MDLCSVINKFSGISDVLRTGLVNRGVKQPESVAEHTLGCLLIAFKFLPNGHLEDGSEWENDKYNKTDIMNLLLVHDLGETEIGDIVRGQKTLADRVREREAVSNFLSGEQDSVADNGRLLDLWDDMEAAAPTSLNAAIAKDIDILQGAYQVFKYATTGRLAISETLCMEWLQEVSDVRIKTRVGRLIRKELIFNNPDFLQNAIFNSIMKQTMPQRGDNL